MWKGRVIFHINSNACFAATTTARSKSNMMQLRTRSLSKTNLHSLIYIGRINRLGCQLSKIQCHFEQRSSRFERAYGTRSSQTFSSAHAANQFVRWLLPEERSTLLEALKEFESEKDSIDDGNAQPTSKQLKLVATSNAIPFIGFGFLDNAIMILAGEYIDHTIGLTLGISTMAAAAVGNLISDLMGLGLAGYVEAIAIRLGFDVPPMSTRQASMWKTKYTAYLGRGIGVAIGCIIGMFPLLFYGSAENEIKENEPQINDDRPG